MTGNIQYFGNRLNFILRRNNAAHVFSNDQLAIATCKICYVSDHSIDICPVFQMTWVPQSILLKKFHFNFERGMTLIQTGMIKDGGTTPTLIM